MEIYFEHRGPITLACISSIERTRIGVTKYSKYPDQKYNKELGRSIALHRAQIQPFAEYPHELKPAEFEDACDTIVAHIQACGKHWQHIPKRLPKSEQWQLFSQQISISDKEISSVVSPTGVMQTSTVLETSEV